MNDRNTTIWLMESTKRKLDLHFKGRETYDTVLNRVLEKAKSEQTVKLLGNAVLKELNNTANYLMPIMNAMFTEDQIKVLKPAMQKVMESLKRIEGLIKNPPKAETQELLSETFGQYMRNLQKVHPEFFNREREDEE